MPDDLLSLLVGKSRDALRKASPDLAGTTATALLALTSQPWLASALVPLAKALVSTMLAQTDRTGKLVSAMANAPFLAALDALNDAFAVIPSSTDEQSFRAQRCAQALGHLDIAAHQSDEGDQIVVLYLKAVASMHMPGGLPTSALYFREFAAQCRVRGQGFDKCLQVETDAGATESTQDTTAATAARLVRVSDGFSVPTVGNRGPGIKRRGEDRFDRFFGGEAFEAIQLFNEEQLRRQLRADQETAESLRSLAREADELSAALLAQSGTRGSGAAEHPSR